MFLLDDKRISEINMVSGRTKKKIPKIHPFLNRVVTMASSQNGELNTFMSYIFMTAKTMNGLSTMSLYRCVALWTSGLRGTVPLEQG